MKRLKNNRPKDQKCSTTKLPWGRKDKTFLVPSTKLQQSQVAVVQIQVLDLSCSEFQIKVLDLSCSEFLDLSCSEWSSSFSITMTFQFKHVRAKRLKSIWLKRPKAKITFILAIENFHQLSRHSYSIRNNIATQVLKSF